MFEIALLAQKYMYEGLQYQGTSFYLTLFKGTAAGRDLPLYVPRALSFQARRMLCLNVITLSLIHI